MTTTTTTPAAETAHINDIDVGALQRLVEEVKADPNNGEARFSVTTRWQGGTRTETSVDFWEIGGRREGRGFTIPTDEPPALLGQSRHANPQEVLMAGMNACMMVGYAALCSAEGITLEKLEIETDGELDLRGFLALDRNVKPGYDELRYTVRIKGDGTPEQFKKIHEAVQKTSPNYFNLSQPVRLVADLQVE